MCISNLAALQNQSNRRDAINFFTQTGLIRFVRDFGSVLLADLPKGLSTKVDSKDEKLSLTHLGNCQSESSPRYFSLLRFGGTPSWSNGSARIILVARKAVMYAKSQRAVAFETVLLVASVNPRNGLPQDVSLAPSAVVRNTDISHNLAAVVVNSSDGSEMVISVGGETLPPGGMLPVRLPFARNDGICAHSRCPPLAYPTAGRNRGLAC